MQVASVLLRKDTEPVAGIAFIVFICLSLVLSFVRAAAGTPFDSVGTPGRFCQAWRALSGGFLVQDTRTISLGHQRCIAFADLDQSLVHEFVYLLRRLDTDSQ